jgi:hypothetical protein
LPGQAHLDLLAREAVRHTVVMTVGIDVRYPCLLPMLV